MKNLFTCKMNELTVGQTILLSIAVGLVTTVFSYGALITPAVVDFIRDKRKSKEDKKNK